VHGGDLSSGKTGAASIAFQETASAGTFACHNAPTRQFVITLSGTLDFQTRDGEHFVIRPGGMLLWGMCRVLVRQLRLRRFR
jgi:hypothetical protein